MPPWSWQAIHYGKPLAEQAESYGRDREQAAAAVIDWQERQQVERRALEDRLQTNDQTHYKARRDAQTYQTRLRDQLATADVRLSVLLAAAPSGGGGLSTAAGVGSVVHGVARAELAPAVAQRIVAITGDGDQGLIALRACQKYVHESYQQ
ncbi:lysis protein [Pseudomonas sp. MAFF 302046]|uniref:Lysis protein n=1 Tax=Pseudomonas morbosilactucae TaxID=2938197 RepID=A0ABT0JQC7_9PSED|nr:lysis system i-spanin subunit Rz [Pseudomonas morbosilactucae]MCK9818153.1 lysis protein [Pseudomonas morbosilactucae]